MGAAFFISDFCGGMGLLEEEIWNVEMIQFGLSAVQFLEYTLLIMP